VRYKTDTSKDIFTAANRSFMEKKEQGQHQKLDRMKKYGRWLFYEGVDHLPKDKKKVYHFEKLKQAERKRAQEKRDANASPTLECSATMIGSPMLNPHQQSIHLSKTNEM